MGKIWNFIKIKGWLFGIALLFGLLLSLYLILKSLQSSKLQILIYLLGIIILIVMVGMLSLVIINQILKFSSIKKAKNYFKKKNAEVAVILGYDTLTGYLISTYLGTEYLFEFLKLKEKDFIVYITPSKKKFKEIVNNENIKIIYLIGHGSSRGFELNKKEGVSYSDYRDSKILKDEIHLYHCGHGDGKTLIDYLVKQKNRKRCHRYFDKERVIFYVLEFYNLYKKELNKRKEGK